MPRAFAFPGGGGGRVGCKVSPHFRHTVADPACLCIRRIDFHEFLEVMQVQWKGMDLDKVVKKIKDHDEAKKAAEDKGPDLAPIKTLTADMYGVKINLKYFGLGTNAFLLFVYGLLALAAVWYLWLEVPDDLFNLLLAGSLGGMSALFAIGGLAMHQHRWVTIKLYAVMMFFGGGCQFAMCFLWFAGVFDVQQLVVVNQFDAKCGTCLREDASDCGGDGGLLGSVIGGVSSLNPLGESGIDYANMPWYCCCAHNDCLDLTKLVRTRAQCEDGCPLANLTGDESAARDSCRDMGASFNLESGRAACDYSPPVGALPPTCTAPAGANDTFVALCQSVEADAKWELFGRTYCQGKGCDFDPGREAIGRRCTQAETTCVPIVSR